MTDSVSTIKRAQKESLLYQQISTLFMQAAMDDIRLHEVFINRVKLSPDKGTCWVYFYTPGGKAKFDEVLEVLKLYKPSLRCALAKSIRSRYTPDLRFAFDEQFEKEQRINELLQRLKEEGEL